MSFTEAGIFAVLRLNDWNVGYRLIRAVIVSLAQTRRKIKSSSPTTIFIVTTNTRSQELNSPTVCHGDVRKECRQNKNDRSSTITMALINMQSAEHSCLNSTTFVCVCACANVCVCVCVCLRVQVCVRATEWENRMEWAYSDSLGALQNINRFCFVTLNGWKGINAWDRVEEKRPLSTR